MAADKRPTWDHTALTKAQDYKLLRNISGMAFAMTGEMSVTRPVMALTIQAAGGVVHDAIRDTTKFLVVPNDPDFRKGSKYKEAQRQGKAIISEQELCDMIMPTVDDLLGALNGGGSA